MLRFCCLGSGSRGNAFVIEAGDAQACVRVLLDDGFAPRELERRLLRAGVDLASLTAVFVTHEHSDHAGGVAAFAKRRDLAVYATEGTARAAGFDRELHRLHRLHAGRAVRIGPLQVQPVEVPHDAAEPVQFVFSDGQGRLAVVTDLGHPAPAVVAQLSALDALVIEFNHDLDMLRSGSYPGFLKARIESELGHLSNDQSAQLVGAIDHARLRRVVGAHLSQTNNRPQLALDALARLQLPLQVQVELADQALGLGWRVVAKE